MHETPNTPNNLNYNDKFALDILKATCESIIDYCEDTNRPTPQLTLVAITDTIAMPAGFGEIKPQTIRKAAAALLNIADEQEENQNV